MMKLRNLVRALLRPKVWNRRELATILSDELFSNWFSLEQKTKLANKFVENRNLGIIEVPMAWSANEALAPQWKLTFEPLKLWIAVNVEFEDEPKKITWLPMVWPSYLAALRWQLLIATRSDLGPRITLNPDLVGFSRTALVDTTVNIGQEKLTETNVHFLLPDEEVLRLSNPNVPNFEGVRVEAFSPWRFREGQFASGELFSGKTKLQSRGFILI